MKSFSNSPTPTFSVSAFAFSQRLAALAGAVLLWGNVAQAQTTVNYAMSSMGLADATLVGTSVRNTTDSNITFTFAKNSSSTAPTYYVSGTAVRLYQNATKGGSIKIMVASGFKITAFTVTTTSGDGDGPSAYLVDGGTEAGTWADGTTSHAVTGINATSYVEFYNKGGSSSTRSYVVSFSATYASAGSTYTLTYDGNGSTGGSAPTDGSSPYTPPATVTVLGNTGSLVKTGSIFAGWNTAADGSGTAYSPGNTFSISANTTLYAQWTPVYTVTYSGNGNTGGTAPTDGNTYANGATVTVLANTGTLTKTGYTFSGWNTASDGTGTDYAASGSDTFVMGSANVTLFAKWIINTYTVTYDGNTSDGGTAPVDGSSPYTYNSTVTVLGVGTLTKSGNAFTGWNTAPDGSGSSYSPGGTFSIAANTVLYAQWASSPTITLSGTLDAADTTYGIASPTPTSFTVSGTFLTGELTVASPSGFEVSTNVGSDYFTSIPVGEDSGTVNSTTIYVRLAATATVSGSPYSGDITVSGGGAMSQTVATGSSAVSPKDLTITGLSGVNKPYDQTTAATVTGTAALNGIVSGDESNVTLGGTPTANFTTGTAGTAKSITVSGYSISGSASANYSLTQPAGLVADITPLALTVSGAAVDSKPYDGTTAATISGATLVGVLTPDVVTIATSTGTFVGANVGTGIAVTANLTLGGADAANYTLTQPTGLTGDITQASQTITFGALPSKTIGDADFTLTATASSGLAVSYASSDPSVATVSGATVTIVGVGTTTITASQAGNGNYLAAADVPRDLVVAAPLIAGWDFQTTSGGGTAAEASPSSPVVYTANFGTGTIYLDGSFGSSSWFVPASGSTGTEVNGFGGTTVNAAPGFSTTTTGVGALALVGGTGQSANGKSVVFKFTMANRANLVASYATQRTGAGFDAHAWEYSTDGIAWTAAETVGSIPSSFATKTLATITGLNGASTAYLRLTVTGASNATGNNRLDNIQLRAITPVAVTLSGSKSYDETTTVPASALVVDNNSDGANLTLSGSVVLSSANGGLQSITDFSGLTLGGSAASKYTLTGASGSVRINPAPGAMTMATLKNTAANLKISKLLAVAHDAGVTLSVSAVQSPTTAGGTAAISAGDIVYTPATDYTGSDTISYTLSDDVGGSSTGTVSVTVNSENVGLRITDIDVTSEPGHVIITASGLPTTPYKVQKSDDSGGSWQDYDTTTTAANGVLIYTDLTPNAPVRWYRLAQAAQ